MNYSRICSGARLLAVGAILLSCTAGTAVAQVERRSEAAKIAAKILDDTQPAEPRQKLAAESAEISKELIETMASGLQANSDLKEEYRRIPWIWRVAIAAGKRNQEGELRRILEISLPAEDGQLRDWQSVVIGGGIINGIGLVGGWPAERIEAIVAGDPGLKLRWEQVRGRASEMADDVKVFKGTRYDAIRILGVGSWDRRGAQIFKYLLRGVDEELQMGAISALGDMKSPSIGQALLSGMTFYSAKNREMALDALIREDSRIRELLFAIEEGRVSSSQLGEARVAKLRKVADPDLRTRAEKLLGTE